MKTIQLIAASIVAALLTGCDANEPVQTATVISDSSSVEETPGSTSLTADSVQASPNGPDQMVPENSTATQTVSGSKH